MDPATRRACCLVAVVPLAASGCFFGVAAWQTAPSGYGVSSAPPACDPALDPTCPTFEPTLRPGAPGTPEYEMPGARENERRREGAIEAALEADRAAESEEANEAEGADPL